ncbi:leucine-rich repeat-containing protein 15-like [Ptychodera flava]|uniref:leucine-rich repeat-containing protein 15-like n=1 Tax=Ptychodera flava TaxID=63121 RepID=UPI00396A446D
MDFILLAVLAITALTSHHFACGFDERVPVSEGQECSRDDTNKRVDCTYRDLDTIPDNIPSDTKILILKSNKIRQLPPRAFSALQHLEELYLNQNNIHNISEDAFDGLSILRELHLSGNKELTALPTRVFQPLKNLQVLKLASTGLTLLPQGIFSRLSKLQTLYMTDNYLNQLPVNVFSDLNQLDSLDLYGNFLSDVTPGTFAGLSQLSYLSLANNRLTNLSGGLFETLHNLNILDMQENHISSIHYEAFNGLHNLAKLYLMKNQLTEIPNALRVLWNVEKLNLNDNQINNLDTDIFRDLSELNELLLSGNRFTAIPSGFSLSAGTDHQVFQELTKLSMSRNSISSIERSAFSRLVSLQELNLQETGLQSVDVDGFLGLHSLHTLWLNDNRLETLSKYSISSLRNLWMIHLYRNPWVCNCTLFELLDYIQTSMTLTYVEEATSQCLFPLHLRSTALVDLTSSDVDCSNSSLGLPPTVVVTMTTIPTKTEICRVNAVILGVCITLVLASVAMTVAVMFLWQRQQQRAKKRQSIHYIPYTDNSSAYLDLNGSLASSQHGLNFNHSTERGHPNNADYMYSRPYENVPQGQNNEVYTDVNTLQGHTYQSLRSPVQLETSDGYLVPSRSIRIPDAKNNTAS